MSAARYLQKLLLEVHFYHHLSLFLRHFKCKLGVFHPDVCTCNSILYLTVITRQCGAMLLLCNYQLSDMFRPYRAIIRLYKIMVIRCSSMYLV